jgi:hypothetical protein
VGQLPCICWASVTPSSRKGFLAWLCLANVIMAGGYAEIYED